MKHSTMVGIVVVAGVVAGATWYTGFWGTQGGERMIPSSVKSATVSPAAASSVRVINVLDKATFDDAHIKGSIQIDSDKVLKAARDWDKSTTIVVYCANYMCSSSRDIAKKLAAAGFTNVKAYEGGTAEWYQLAQADPSYVVEGPAQESYLKKVLKPAEDQLTDALIITAAELKALLKGS